MHHNLFISSPDDWHLGCFQFLVILNKAAINIFLQVFVCTLVFILLGSVPRSDNCFVIPVCVWLFSRVVSRVANLHPHQRCMRVPVVLYLAKTWYYQSFFSFSHPAGYVSVKVFPVAATMSISSFHLQAGLSLVEGIVFCCHWVSWCPLGQLVELQWIFQFSRSTLVEQFCSPCWSSSCLTSGLFHGACSLCDPLCSDVQVPYLLPGCACGRVALQLCQGTCGHFASLSTLPPPCKWFPSASVTFFFWLHPSQAGNGKLRVWRPLTASLLVEGSEACLFKLNRGCQR